MGPELLLTSALASMKASILIFRLSKFSSLKCFSACSSVAIALKNRVSVSAGSCAEFKMYLSKVRTQVFSYDLSSRSVADIVVAAEL